MILKTKWFVISLLFIFISSNLAFSQEDTRDYDKLEAQKLTDSVNYFNKKFNQLVIYDYRGTNVFEASLGASTLIGGVEDTSYGMFYKLGYKRLVTDHLLLGLSYNSYNLSYVDIEQDLVSFDFNIEFLALPYDTFSPFLFGGFGYNTLNDFETSAVKLQAGFGFEFIVASKLGLKLFAEYNYSLDDEMDVLINDLEDDSFLRLGFGINLYFGGENQKQKRLKTIPTKIKTNYILPEE
jgi:curli production assembly/transport component CsgG